MVSVARWICGRWFNHLSLYTGVWTVTIFFYDLHLIEYYEVSFEAWFYILVAWVALFTGTALVKFGTVSKAPGEFPALHMKRLRLAIILLSTAGLASSAQLAFNIVRALGSGNLYVALTEYANQIYTMRFYGEVSGLMYLNFLPFAGCVLAGILVARTGRLTLIALLPLLSAIIDGIISMQRGGMFVCALTTWFAYHLTPKVSQLFISKWQKIAVAIILLGAIILITGRRSGTASYQGEDPKLAQFGDFLPIAPVLYFYASAPIPCFSEYLKQPDLDGKDLWGRYIFASIYRFLSKIGFDTYVPYYQNFYNVPEPVNVGTYLREIHHDFGPSAIFLYPCLLGLVIAWLERLGGLYPAVLLTFLYLVIAQSFDVNFVGSGGWYFPLPVALFAAALAKVRPKKLTAIHQPLIDPT